MPLPGTNVTVAIESATPTVTLPELVAVAKGTAVNAISVPSIVSFSAEPSTNPLTVSVNWMML